VVLNKYASVSLLPALPMVYAGWCQDAPGHDMTQHDTDRSASNKRVTVEDAAQILGVSVDAIRKRIERGTLESKRLGKTRYVLLDDTDMTDQDTIRTRHDSDITGVVEELRAHNETLRKQLDAERGASSELRRIIAALTQRIPELEPARETTPDERESPVTASEDRGNGGSQGYPEQEKRSWWQRWFGA
jgi:excisionase family DNA binding protein